MVKVNLVLATFSLGLRNQPRLGDVVSDAVRQNDDGVETSLGAKLVPTGTTGLEPVDRRIDRGTRGASGENAFVTGDWAPVVLTTTDNFDFTGGDGGTAGDLGGGLRIVRPDVTCDPMAKTGSPLTGWFDTSCFARPSGRGDYGDAPRNAVRKPGLKNWNLALFKNVQIGGRRSFQYRLEAYNVLNNVQFQDVDRTARFDTTGALAVSALLLGFANAVVKPLLVVLTLPLTFLTFGLFLLVINALMILLVAALVRGFRVSGFWTALFASIFVSLLSLVIGSLLGSGDPATTIQMPQNGLWL